MSAKPLPVDMTADEFLTWSLSQEDRYELVDGVPVPLHGMAGESNFHDAIVVRLIAMLFGKLSGSGCEPRTADTVLRTSIKRVRRPDVTVECGPIRSNHYESSNPVAAFEVLSPSTRGVELVVKLAEYQRHPSLRTIVHLDPERMEVAVFRRDAAGVWNDGVVQRSPEDMIAVADTGAVLTLAEIYAGLPMVENVSGSADPDIT
jgi:Uma2 family endonuclease